MKLGIFSTHPIQYQVPLWRMLDAKQNFNTKVYYFSDHGVSGNVDPDFGDKVTWDLPLLEGYDYEFISKRPIEEQIDFKIHNVDKFLRENSIDVILLHGYMHKFSRQLIRKKKKYGFKVILRAEFTDMGKSRWNLRAIARVLYLKWFYSKVDHFCPIGLDAIHHLKNKNISDINMTMAPYSVDDKLFETQQKSLSRSEYRMELGIQANDCVFLFSGKMIPRKQPLLLAEAILRLQKEYNNLAVIFLGSGEQYKELTKVLKSLPGCKFIAPGFVNQTELGKYFIASDVFVLPSTYDTWGLVVNEAMHFGLPCIASNMVGSGRDLVIEGETGFTFKFDNLDELTSKMQYFLNNPESTIKMGQNAHQRIQKYTVEKTCQGIKTAIERVADYNYHV